MFWNIKKIKLIVAIFISSTVALGALVASALTTPDDIAARLAGQILLQTEGKGEAWYVNPPDRKKYFLGRPDDAFAIMKRFGIGITSADLEKIPVGIVAYNYDYDDDSDGLTNRLEAAIGTNPQQPDSDADGYNDKQEVDNWYNPVSTSTAKLNSEFAEKHSGQIFLQIENHGQAWYINPRDYRRYFLGRPADAFTIMQSLSRGTTNADLDKIITGYISTSSLPVCPLCQSTTIPSYPPNVVPPTTSPADSAFTAAHSAIRSGDKATAKKYFTSGMQTAVDYTMNFLDTDGKFTLGNIMSGATLKSQTADTATYSTDVYFSLGGYKVTVNFVLKKQADGTWLLSNL